MKLLVFSFALLSILILMISCSSPIKEQPKPLQQNTSYSKAIFAGGCFWCSEAEFEKVEGVIEVYSGYTGGREETATYKQTSKGDTKHREAVLVYYNSSQVSYSELLKVFWTHIDPTDEDGQFVDRGYQYTSAIYYVNENQRKLAEQSRNNIEKSNIFEEPIITPIIESKPFYKAEEYHQNYYDKNPLRYKFYRSRSGRDEFIEKHWNNVPDSVFYLKPSDEELKKILSPLQYRVTQKDGTEAPFDNKYWNNSREGIYVDVLSGEPLFSSTDKYKSGTGWPSFTKPIDNEFIIKKSDFKLIVKRTELRSKYSNSHLGHLFNDGPREKGGQRYCVNSASLRFIPKENLKEEGYQEYVSLFST